MSPVSVSVAIAACLVALSEAFIGFQPLLPAFPVSMMRPLMGHRMHMPFYRRGGFRRMRNSGRRRSVTSTAKVTGFTIEPEPTRVQPRTVVNTARNVNSLGGVGSVGPIGGVGGGLVGVGGGLGGVGGGLGGVGGGLDGVGGGFGGVGAGGRDVVVIVNDRDCFDGFCQGGFAGMDHPLGGLGVIDPLGGLGGVGMDPLGGLGGLSVDPLGGLSSVGVDPMGGLSSVGVDPMGGLSSVGVDPMGGLSSVGVDPMGGLSSVGVDPMGGLSSVGVDPMGGLGGMNVDPLGGGMTPRHSMTDPRDPTSAAGFVGGPRDMGPRGVDVGVGVTGLQRTRADPIGATGQYNIQNADTILVSDGAGPTL